MLLFHQKFSNRIEAGALLAEKLQAYKGKKDTLVLALVRGGVAIGRAIANSLKLPLYPYIVRKIGHPSNREFGIGAIAEGGSTYVDEGTMKWQGLTWHDLEPIAEEEMKEMQRRKEAYLISARPDLKGKTIILTDDGAATGGTLFAAIEDLRKFNVQKIIVAIPVCPPDTAQELAKRADALTVLLTPEPFNAVGQWYEDFPQLEDQEVLELLKS